ncbi:MAG: hypothetical protein Q8S22_04795 [Eubacteriales bacterium]|nr:hypothetical protein [Eubacteriales bacterium]
MNSEKELLSTCVDEYCCAVAAGRLPRAYRGILSVLNAFKASWEEAHPTDNVGALYQGYLDMSFVAVLPTALAAKRLKISLVFLHPTGQFSFWLIAGNRAIQKAVSDALRVVPLGEYTLCTLQPGVDAIISRDLPKPYLFDEPEKLDASLMQAAESFAADMVSLVAKIAP